MTPKKVTPKTAGRTAAGASAASAKPKAGANRKPAAKAAARRKSGQPVPLADLPVDTEVWRLRLYVAGQTAKSVVAFANLKRICEEHLQGQYEIEVVDLLSNPQLAKGDQILAIPTLVRKLPLPVRKIIGDLSNTERVLVGLDVRPR